MKISGDVTLVAQNEDNNTTKVESPEEKIYGDATLVAFNKAKNTTTVAPPMPAHNNTTEVVYPKYSNLPHIDLIGYYQFVTFRTSDSIDEFLKRIREEEIPNNIKEYKIDTYLDNSQKGCYLNNQILEFLYEYFKQQDKVIYELVAFCIMPNHIHILFKQNEELKKIIQTIKGGTSVKINKMLSKNGIFWEKGYFDRVIRDENHFVTTYEYIKNNPIKANLKDYENRFYGIYE